MKRFLSLLKIFFTKPEYVFVVPALVFGLLSAFLMPQLINNDENMHFIRSYQLTELEVNHKCTLPVDIKERGFYAMYTGDYPDYSFGTKKVDESSRVDTDCGTATSYNPLLHLPQTIGFAIAKLVWPTTGGMILFGRIANALFYCIALFFIIRKARIGKWLLVVVGLIPMMIHMAGSLTGDVVNNVILLSFITYMFNLFVQKTAMSRKQIGILVILSALLAVTKMTNLVLLLPVLFLPKNVLPTMTIKKKKIPKSFTKLIIGGLCGIVAISVIIVWAYLYGSSPAGGVDAANPVSEKPYRFLKILFNTYVNSKVVLDGVSYGDWLLRGMFGGFASFSYWLPYSVTALLTGLIAFIGLRKENDPDEKVPECAVKPLMASANIALFLVISAMTYGLYVAWAIPVRGEGVQFALGLQGRYFTPLIILLLPTLIYLRRFVSVNIKKGVATGILVFSIMTFSLIFYIVQTLNFIATLPA